MSEIDLPNPSHSAFKLHFQKEADVFKQKLNSGQQFATDYKEEVIYPNTIKLFIYAIFVYILYLALDILLYNFKAMAAAESERNYLISEEEIASIRIQTRLANIKMFVDFYREIAEKKENFTATGCNATRFQCNTNWQKLIHFVQFGYDSVMSSFEHLVLASETRHDAELFIFDIQTKISFRKNILSYNLNQNLNYPITPKVIELVYSHNSPAYLIKIIKKESEGTYEMKVLFCGKVPAIGPWTQICVISPGNLEDLRIGKQNEMVIINEDALGISKMTTPQELVQFNKSGSANQESSIAYNISRHNVAENDRLFYESFNLEQCVLNYKKTQFLIQNKVRICNPPQILNFLSPVTIFVYSAVELNPRYYQEEMKSPARIANFQITFLLSSNTTFAQKENAKMKALCKKQSLVIQAMITILSLWVILMPIFPLKLVSSNIATSVNLLIKMCKVVKSIKCRDDLEIQIDSFNKLNIEINKGSHIFYSTIEYFKYFIWYRKWLYTTKQSKKKLLLEEGLTLFGSVDDAPVYMYIYQKQIQNEAKVADNYNKLRKIFTQKLVLYRDEERIEENAHTDHQRNAVVKCKKSGFLKMEQEMEIGNAYSRDFCMTDSQQKKIQNRINKQLQLMEIQKKSKRYVRFSNDLQQQQKPLQFRVSKFLLNIPSQSNIVRFSQESIEEQMRRKQDEDAGSIPVESSRQDKLLNEAKDQESSHSEKNLQNWNMFLKFDELDESNDQDAEDDFFDVRKITYNKLDEKLCESYQNLFRIYQKMINSKKMYLEKQEVVEVSRYMNKLYWMLIEKLRYTYKFIKLKNNQRQKMLKTLNKKLVQMTKEKHLIKELEKNWREKLLGSEKVLQETISVIGEQIEQESKLIDIQFREFSELEEKYKIDAHLIERAQLYQIKMKKTLNYPIPYKKLESLCDSKNQQIRVEARVVMAQQFYYISPHADLEVIMKAQQNLQQNHTTNIQKQKSLKLIKRVLKNRQFMEEEQTQIELIKNYYNYVHKKIYFVVDLSDNYEVFLPTIQQIYKNMNQVDMFQIMNLAMNEILQDMVINGSELKPPKLSDFQSKFENIHNEANRIRSVASTKIGNKKMAFEKDFNRIISKIQRQEINLSKFIVLMLGGENQTQSKTHQDFESSSAQNRQNYQVVHQQILSRLQKNYFHLILVGFNLRDYQTRQGKLKKYVRHTHDLFQIDLSKPSNERCLKQLGKFFSN